MRRLSLLLLLTWLIISLYGPQHKAGRGSLPLRHLSPVCYSVSCRGKAGVSSPLVSSWLGFCLWHGHSGSSHPWGLFSHSSVTGKAGVLALVVSLLTQFLSPPAGKEGLNRTDPGWREWGAAQLETFQHPEHNL